MGTELQKRGMPDGACPEAWCLENPRVVSEVHADYKRAGADVVYTCTFGANRIKLSEYKIRNVREVNMELARLARRAVGKGVLVAGDIGPTGLFVEPFGDCSFEAAVNIYKEQVRGLLDGGVDIFAVETMMDIQEARAALIAVKELTKAFTIVTMTFEKGGKTLNGTDPLTALITLQGLGADAVGANCSQGPAGMLEMVARLKPYASVPLVAKPNAGMPELKDEKTVFSMDPREFASFGRAFISKGVNMLGGCCGTTPAHIRALAGRIKNAGTKKPVLVSLGAVSSARKTVLLGHDKPLTVVGECINPTGKKMLQAELREGRMALVRQFAKDQEKKGAELLDVNAGLAGADEKKLMTSFIDLLSVITDLPLVIDSSDAGVLEAALRIYPGRALINSISGEKQKLRKLLPVARKYGAMFIALPIDDKGVAESFEKRKKIINAIISEAKKKGFTDSDMVVDGLVLTVSSNPGAAVETMKTVSWASRGLGLQTIVGLSNISFGLPRRPRVNADFLSMLQANGLTMALLNPLDEEVMSGKRSSDLLMSKDKDAALYIAHCGASPDKKVSGTGHQEPPETMVGRAIIEGNREEIIALIEGALKKGTDPYTLVDDVMIPAINKVGELFDKKECFLPQLIASAETMKKAFDHLQGYLKKGDSRQIAKTAVILATVKGDIHDIGKNIVSLLLKNHGFQVIDLGKDVTAEAIVREAKRHKSPIVGLSALMTTTMVNMKEVVELAGKQGLKCRFLLGGAVVTKAYAESLGAEYAGDGVEAVRVVKQISER